MNTEINTMNDFKGKAINFPLENGSNYDRFRVELSREFEALRVKAIELLYPFAEKELNDVSRNTVYFKVKNDEVSSEFDCCDNEKCIERSKKAIRKSYGKGTHVEECWSFNDGDHDDLETCYECGKHLNTQLTWVEHEFEYIKENELTKEFIISEAFVLYCILEAIPSNDHDLNTWSIQEYINGNTLYVDLRAEFYENLMDLSYSVVNVLNNQESPILVN